MTSRRPRAAALIASLLIIPFLIAAAPTSQRQQPRQLGEANDPRLRAEALDMLYELDLNADQLRALEKLAAPGKADPPARLGKKLRSAVNDLCDALARGDDDKIADLQDKVDELSDAANIDDAYVEPSDAAKSNAAGAIKLLTAGQLASFIAVYADDVQGPAELLIDAMDDARGGGNDAEYKDLRADTADEVVALTRGPAARDAKLADAVGTFLDRVRKLSDADYKSKHDALEDEARKIVGPVDPMTALHHWVEEEFAHLLSNPELGEAVHARIKHAGEHKGGDHEVQPVALRIGADTREER